MKIERLVNLDQILDIKKTFEEENNINILNVSDWNCSIEFKDAMTNVFEADYPLNYVDYAYSYSLPNILLEELQIKYLPENRKKKDIMITPNNTVSIVYVANLIKQLNMKKICIVAPAYFSVYSIMDAFNIDYDIISLNRIKDHFRFVNHVDWKNYDAIWVTSPIFCSSVQLPLEFLNLLKTLSKNKLVITDESFCENGYELSKDIGLNNHIGIYSPHKAIGLNSFKFSIITFDKEFMDILEQWSDVLCGGLNISNINAIKHFISPNYTLCNNVYKQFINEAKRDIQIILNDTKSLSTDVSTTSNMIMIYSNKLSASLLHNSEFYKNIMYNTSGCILPGYLHDYNENFGFCFRINLCLYNKHFNNIFRNICQYLD